MICHEKNTWCFMAYKTNNLQNTFGLFPGFSTGNVTYCIYLGPGYHQGGVCRFLCKCISVKELQMEQTLVNIMLHCHGIF